MCWKLVREGGEGRLSALGQAGGQQVLRTPGRRGPLGGRKKGIEGAQKEGMCVLPRSKTSL